MAARPMSTAAARARRAQSARPAWSATRACLVDADCQSQVCSMLRCAAPTCADARKNGAETDVDCGGSGTCMRCALGKGCLLATDCASTYCSVQLVCAMPTCNDN